MQELSVSLEQTDNDEDTSLQDLEPEQIHDEETMKKWLASLTREDLEDRLEEAVEDENYEYAKLYQDELKRRDK